MALLPSESADGKAPAEVIAKLQGKARIDAINIISFGAMPDDGFDDSDAIQAAVNAGFKYVYIPAGIFEVSKGVELPSNIEIFGDGKYISMIHARSAISENFSWTQNRNGLYSGGLFKATSKRNIVIREVGFDGNRKNQRPYTATANLLFSRCSHVDIVSVYSINSMMDSITFLGGEHNSVLNSITANNGYSGISTGLAQAYLDQEIPDYQSQSEYFTATGNASNSDGLMGASAMSINGRWSVVANNHIVKAGLIGITIGHSLGPGANGRKHTPPQDASGAVVSNNLIEESSVVSGLAGSGIAIGYVANGAVISRNIIDKSFGYGISAGQRSTAVGLVVIDNKIINTSISGIFLGGALHYVLKNNTINTCGTGELIAGGTLPKVIAGIYVNSTVIGISDQFGSIEGNSIENCGSATAPVVTGVYVIYARSVKILRNSIGERLLDSNIYMKHGVYVDASAHQVEVLDNSFYVNATTDNESGYVVINSKLSKQLGNRFIIRP